MAETDPYDPDAVKARYLAERDKRLVPGRAQIRDLSRDPFFARFTEDPFTPVREREPVVDDVDVVIVGGGIAGICAGVELRKAGVERIRVVDKAGGFGGTWYWNRYPGVMCDVEATIYLPMLEETGYVPRDRYASGEEIRTYLVGLAERFDLDGDALFHTGVEETAWDDAAGHWQVRTDRGDHLTSRWYVLASGILNLMKLPAVEGMEDFAGESFHSARWNYEYTGGAPGRPLVEEAEPLTGLADKTVGLVGTGASGIQILPHLAASAEQVYVFQRTPSAIGVRDNRPLPPDFADDLEPGWQQRRMDNFQAIMLGKPVDEDLIDDGWTHHFAPAHHPPRWEGMTMEDYIRSGEETDFAIMEEHRRRVDELVDDPATAAALKPWYRYICKRPCFHDEFLQAFNEPNVTLVDCPAGFDRVAPDGPVVAGETYAVDCLVYGTGFEAEVTPLPRRVGHQVVGREGVTLADKFAEGPETLFGMLSRGFPNLFVMPAPAQQCVVTVNYTQLAVLGAEFVGGAVRTLRERGADVFDVTEEAEAAWVDKVVSGFVDGSAVMAQCTPSRINNEGRPEEMNPRQANWGRGYGDYFGYRERLQKWVADGTCEGLELETRP